MRKISLIQAVLWLCLVTPLFSAPDRLRLGDFPTEAEKKEDERARRRQHQEMVVEPSLVPETETKPLPVPTPPPAVQTERSTPLSPIVKPAPNVAPAPKPVRAPRATSKAAPKSTMSTEELKSKSGALYLEALTASQNGDIEAAYLLCQKALRLDPMNLQAERMVERLELRRRK